MKILISHPLVTQGGAERQVVELAYWLGKMGEECTILSAGADLTNLPEKAEKLDYLLPKHEMKLAPRAMKIGSIYNQLKIFIEMRKLAKRHNNEYDVLNPHNFPAILTTLKPHKPTVWMCNEPSPYFGKIEGYAAKRVETIAVIDPITQKRVREAYGRTPEVVWSGVDYDFFSKARGKKRGFELLQVGVIQKDKNQECSIRALAKIREKIPEATLVIIGREIPEYGARLRRIVKELKMEDKVEFAGRVSEEGLRSAYAKSSLVLFPGIRQALGLTPLEALSAGTFPIVSNDCAAGYLMKKHGIGMYVEPTLEKLAEKILEAYEMSGKKKNGIIRKGKNFVKNNFQWKHYAKRMMGLFEKARNGSGIRE